MGLSKKERGEFISDRLFEYTLGAEEILYGQLYFNESFLSFFGSRVLSEDWTALRCSSYLNFFLKPSSVSMLSRIDYVFSNLAAKHFLHRSLVSAGFEKENYVESMEFMAEGVYLKVLFEGIKNRDSEAYNSQKQVYLFL